jgi:hypothetical protein
MTRQVALAGLSGLLVTLPMMVVVKLKQTRTCCFKGLMTAGLRRVRITKGRRGTLELDHKVKMLQVQANADSLGLGLLVHSITLGHAPAFPFLCPFGNAVRGGATILHCPNL